MLSEIFRHWVLIGMSTISVTYWLYTVLTVGVLESISDSVRYVKHPAWFTAFIWTISASVFILGSQGYPILIAAGMTLAFVGAAIKFWTKLTGVVHVVGAMGGIILGYISLIFEFHEILIPAIFALIATALMVWKPRTKIWWTESAALAGVQVSMYIHFW